MEDFIPTRVSKLNKDAVNAFMSVNYEKPKRKRKDNVTENQHGNEVQSSRFSIKINKEEEHNDYKKRQEREMKRIRYEVMKFGMSGFEKVKAEETKVALALSLGAKAPKKKGINYKELKEQRKNTEKKVTRVSGLEKSLITHRTKKIRKKNSNDILEIYGKVNKKVNKNRK
ncbi:uncharacterized protein C1orf131-like [Osmia bicornis bicornis]|uniref:uncharacterized protein C1orf131-like n=1 Tax=Osmia bicornis bicornis TaxID=1437191 RepID=UPI0010F7FC1E|nr:uncharacterized protein C1orf131-like [Osmia bicornis bicornis]